MLLVSPIRTKHSKSSGKSKAVGHGGIRTHIQRERDPFHPTVRRSILTWPGVCEFNTAFMKATICIESLPLSLQSPRQLLRLSIVYFSGFFYSVWPFFAFQRWRIWVSCLLRFLYEAAFFESIVSINNGLDFCHSGDRKLRLKGAPRLIEAAPKQNN